MPETIFDNIKLDREPNSEILDNSSYEGQYSIYSCIYTDKTDYDEIYQNLMAPYTLTKKVTPIA